MRKDSLVFLKKGSSGERIKKSQKIYERAAGKEESDLNFCQVHRNRVHRESSK